MARARSILSLAIVLGACSDGGRAADGTIPTPDAGTGSPGYSSEIYSDDEHWICLPGSGNDACAQSFDATVLKRDGTTEIEPHVHAKDAPFDCFYVYPTISQDDAPNSDLEPDVEIGVAITQAGRLSRVCNLFAPVYRQVTLGSLLGVIESEVSPEERTAIAYADVVDSWKHYLANHNAGKPFVLIGHSQGAGMLRALIRDEIETDEAMLDQLIAAYLLGSAVAVPEGEDVGLSFENVAACRDDQQTGCVVSYATFRDTDPPPLDSRFGKPRIGGGRAICNNPAAISGGRAEMTPYFSSGDTTLIDLDGVPGITTPFVKMPGFLEGECITRGEYDFLELTVLPNPSDPWPDDILGTLTPAWGLHLQDANIAMGDIVDLAETQAEAYFSR